MFEGPAHHHLSDLIGSIYDCSLDPVRWEPTLARVAAAFECAVASLTLNDLKNNRFLINKAAGWDPDLLRKKSEKHVCEINARLTEWLSAQTTLDVPFVTSKHLTRDYIEASAYVEECLRPQGIVDIMHMVLTYSPSQFAELGLGRNERQGVITDREVELGKLLLPHLRRAVTISDLLDARTIESRHMAEALDALHCSVVLTDAAGAILHANRAAECMLRDGSLVTSVRGLLHARSSRGNRELKDAVSLAARDETQTGTSGIAVRLATADAGPAVAHVLPMTGSNLRTRLQPKAVAAVFIARAPDHRSAADLVASSFGLTRAEAQVLAKALNGDSLAEVARSLGVARSTVKSHVDAIYRKTGTSRQAELVRLAMGFVSPLRS